MGKIILLLALATWGCKQMTGRWPWDIWREMDKRGMAGPQKARARTVLGVSSAASRGEIIEAHKRLIARVHPDRGGTSSLVHEANSARDLLLADLPMLEGQGRDAG